ncbi:MAG: hypothetical protein GX572_03895 [Clostridia bacterium]|nr:hypothetical protein [Clostridia bacterium]
MRICRRQKTIISMLAALLLLPFATLRSDLPAMPGPGWTVSAAPLELIAPEGAEKSAAMFGAGVSGASFRERGNFFYAPWHLADFANSPRLLAKAISSGLSLSTWCIVAYIIVMLATVYRHDGKKGKPLLFAYPQI